MLGRILRLRTKLSAWPQLLQHLRSRELTQRTKLGRVVEFLPNAWIQSSPWLSLQVDSTKRIRRRVQEKEALALVERFHLLLHRSSSICASAVIYVITTLATILVSIVIGSLGELTINATPAVDFLIGTAGILAGVAGLLFAVVAFGMQFYGNRVGVSAGLFHFLARREGLSPIAAVSLGTICANITIAFVANFWVPGSAAILAFLDAFVLAPIILFLALWLLYRMAGIISAGLMSDQIISGLRWEFDWAMIRAIRLSEMDAQYEMLLESAGIEQASLFAVELSKASSDLEFELPGGGVVVDVDIDSVRELGALIRKEASGFRAMMLVKPAEKILEGPALVLRAKDPPTGEELKPAVRDRIQAQLERVFRIGPARSDDFLRVIEKFLKDIESRARGGSPEEFTGILEIHEKLVETYLRRSRIRTTTSVKVRRGPPDFARLEYHAEIRAVIEGKDKEKTETLLRFAANLMLLGVQYADEGAFQGGAQVLDQCYALGLRHADLADHIAHSVDFQWHFVSCQLRTLYDRDAPDKRLEQESRLILVRLKFVIRLIKTAIKTGRKEDAFRFHKRLFDWDELHEWRQPRFPWEPALESYVIALIDLHYAAEIALLGWCLANLGNGGDSGMAAANVAQSAQSSLGFREDVLRAWESATRSANNEATLFEKLGCTHPEDNSDAVLRGLAAALLSRPGSAETIDLQLPRVRPIGSKAIESLVDELMANDVMREVLGIEKDKKEDRRRQALAAVDARELVWKQKELENIVEAEIGDQAYLNLKQTILAEIPRQREFLSHLTRLGGLENPASAVVPARPRVPIRIPKKTLCKKNYDLRRFGEIIAGGLCERECVYLFLAAERISTSVSRLEDLGRLKDDVESATAVLASQGYRPTAIVLPRQERFTRALTGMESWRLPMSGEYGRLHIGNWQDKQLWRFPYTNPKGILIIDPGRFFGKHQLCLEDALSFELTPLRQEHEDALRGGRSASIASDVPDVDRIEYLASASMVMGAGVNDMRAVMGIEVDLECLGYATIPTDSLYHHRGCELLAGVERIQYGLGAPNDPRRSPCPQCKPDDCDSNAGNGDEL